MAPAIDFVLEEAFHQLVSEKELRRKLGHGRPLRVKLGIDPTASDIHLGFAVVLRKLRQFQERGHTAVLILGDYTAQIGDPSGRSVTRPRLSRDQVDEYAATYVEQMHQILLPEPLEIRRNSEWLATMSIEDVLRLTSRTTVARMLERDDFAKRYAGGAPISVTEFEPPVDELNEEFPIRLTTGRRLDSYNTGVQTGGYTSPLRRGESIDLSPEDGGRMNFAEGERVRVASRRGSVEVAVRIDPVLRPGLAFMTLHFPDDVATNLLTIDATDPKSGTAEFKATAIRIEKLKAPGKRAAGRKGTWTSA